MWTTLTGRNAALKAGLKCLCARCGQGRLFEGLLALALSCEICGLGYSFGDPADGPAFFAMMTMAIPAAAFAVWIKLAYEPELGGRLLTTQPFLPLSCVPTIHPFKGMLIASQYLNRAGEFRFEIPKQW
jgi:uncharacterized protein (DUF983 family)